MTTFARGLLIGVSVVLVLALGQHPDHAAEMRFALVIGNDNYKTAKLATPANDASLVADTLQAAGFTVTGARNLDQATLRESFGEFLGQVSAAGPDAATAASGAATAGRHNAEVPGGLGLQIACRQTVNDTGR
jgi:uncharacterized caspase-like protein